MKPCNFLRAFGVRLVMPAMGVSAFLLIAHMAPSAANAQDVDCANAVVQMEMTFCAEQDFNAADAELNTVWKKARQAMEETDAALEETSPDMIGAAKALLKAQRAWIDYRDGHCEAYGFEARGGTMEPMLIYACKAELTRARTKELLSLSGQGGE